MPTRVARWTTAISSAIGATPRPDASRPWCGWNDAPWQRRGKSNWPTALALVRERLARAAEAAGRDRDEIELLPITKFFPATDVTYSVAFGLRCIW